MEYQKIIHLLDIISNQPFKFKTKKWVGINDDDARGIYNTNSQIKFKTSMLNSRLCNYSYSKTSGSLYQFCRYEPNNVTAESFKIKSKLLTIQVL